MTRSKDEISAGNGVADATGIYPIRLRPEFKDVRQTFGLETAVGTVLLSTEWSGVPTKETIAVALERVADRAVNPEMKLAAVFLNSLAEAFRSTTDDGWRADLKGKRGGKTTFEKRAGSAKRLIEIGEYYLARYAELGPGSSESAATSTAEKFRCSKGDAHRGVKEVEKAEQLFKELQRMAGSAWLEQRYLEAMARSGKVHEPEE